jgi:hypothetical protein
MLRRHQPHLFHGKGAINSLFGCGGCGRLGVRSAFDDFAGNARGPFPQVAADALHQRIFNLSIFYCHGPDAIVTAGRTTCTGPAVCTGPWAIYNSPATNITAASAIASIAVISSSISLTARLKFVTDSRKAKHEPTN